jgi:CHAD domain-containing protein
LEIEAKFSIPDEETFQRLKDTTTVAGFRLGSGEVAELYDRYLDTAGKNALAQGYALRIRCHGSRYLGTLKGLGTALGAIHRRAEYEVELIEPLPLSAWPPSEARDLALRLCGDDRLNTLFEIRQTRHSRPLYDAEQAVVEFHLDRVHLSKEGVEITTYLELEAELLLDEDEEELEAIASELQMLWGVTPQSQSKFERALALVDLEPASSEEPDRSKEPRAAARLQPTTQAAIPTEPASSVELLQHPGIEPDDPMSEAGRKTFRFHFRRMLYNEPGTRMGEDPEALHDMRVATRRMRAAFRVFDDHFEPKVVAPYLKGLKRTGRALGPVRDLDVLRIKIQAYLDSLPDSEQDGLDGLLEAWEVQRDAARERMAAYLDSAKYARFVDRFAEFVETKGMASLPVDPGREDPRPHRVRHVAPMAIYERLAAVRAYDEWISVPDPPLERLHALRIACKQLRYTMEFFREVLGPDTKSPIKKIVMVQDHLGDLQDAAVARSILREYLEWGTWGPEATNEVSPDAPTIAPGVEAYLAAKQSELEHLVSTFPETWQRLKGAEFSRMVAEAVVVL